MARRTYVYIISLLLLAGVRLSAQDTLLVPLKIRVGFDAAGPVGYFIKNDLKSFGVLGSIDINERFSVEAGTKYSHFSVSEETYDYSSNGMSFVLGPAVNLLKPKMADGQHFIGLGLHYGMSVFSQETPRVEYTNPWGTVSTTLPLSHHTGHFIEFTPGVRTDLTPWLTIGWNISLRVLISDGTDNNLKPVYMPGYGDCSSRIATGASYYISISIPYRTKRIITKPKITEEEEEEEPAENNENSTGNSDLNTRF
jgi:hypothetical protein